MSHFSISLCILACVFLFSTKDCFVLPKFKGEENLGIYVINLDRSEKRLHNVWSPLISLGFSCNRVPAIDGLLLTEEESAAAVDRQAYRKYSGGTVPGAGTIACALSHRKAWKAFLASSHTYAMICEDDIIFSPKELRIALTGLMEASSVWDICMLDINHGGGPLSLYTLFTGQKLCVYPLNISSAGCYVLTRTAAQRLLDVSFPLTMPIDHILTRPWEMGLTLVGIEPRLVKQVIGHSDIARAHRETKIVHPSLKQSARRCMFVTKTAIMRFVYALSQYMRQRFLSF